MSDETQARLERLQSAVLSEFEHSAQMIDAGEMITPRALVLGFDRNYRMSLEGLLHDAADELYLGCLANALSGALLVSAARAFVLTDIDHESRTFTTYGVSETEHAGVIARLGPALQPLVPTPITWPHAAGAVMQSWIPRRPAAYPDDPAWLHLLAEIHLPGSLLELTPAGPLRYGFNLAGGHA